MKAKLFGAFYLISVVSLASVGAQQPFGEDAFIRALADIKDTARMAIPPADSGINPAGNYTKGPADETEIAAQLDQWMSVFNDLEL